MPFSFMSRMRNGYGNIYTPHAGSMIIQVQRENGLANRTIVIGERQVAILRMLGSRLGIAVVTFFLGTWLLFAVLSVRVPMLTSRIAELERDTKRIDSLQVALSRMHGRYEQVRQMLAAVSNTPNARNIASAPASDTSAAAEQTAPSGQGPTSRDTNTNASR